MFGKAEDSDWADSSDVWLSGSTLVTASLIAGLSSARTAGDGSMLVSKSVTSTRRCARLSRLALDRFCWSRLNINRFFPPIFPSWLALQIKSQAHSFSPLLNVPITRYLESQTLLYHRRIGFHNMLCEICLRTRYYVNLAKETGLNPASKWLSWPAKILLASHSAPHSPDGLGASRFGWSQSWHRCSHHDCAHTAPREIT